MVLATIKYEEDGCVWNFAYGSNMNANVLTKRRKINPLESLPGVLHGWKLSFEYQGIPFIEPSWAVVHPGASTDNCHGVLHKMIKEDFIKLLKSEGGGGYDIEGYIPVEVYVNTYDGRSIRAYTLSSRGRLLRGRYPSKRYLQLCHAGASHHKVSQEWLDYLSSHPYHISNKVGVAVLICFMILVLPFGLLVLAFHKLWPSKYIYIVFHILLDILWFIHDLLPKHVQGVVDGVLEKST